MVATIHLCGTLRIDWDGEQLAHALRGRQSRLLFAYLVLHRDRVVRRDELIEALWFDTAPADGDALLRPLLSRLRAALGEGRLDGRAELALRLPDGAWIDWEAARSGLREARDREVAGDHAGAWEVAHGALQIADRGLLPGLEAPWIDRFRTEAEDLRCELLEAIARLGLQLGQAGLVEAERAARRAVELSPFRESARAALIGVLRRRGNLAEALVAYDEVRVLLRDELGTLPGPQLRALHAELMHVDASAGERDAYASALPERLAQALTASWIGRDAALARLRDAAERAAGGAPTLALVTGEGGIGKTRLVAELAHGLPGFDVLYGRCDEEELFPYGPWVELLRRRLDGIDDDALVSLLGPAAADLAHLLPDLYERLPGSAVAAVPTESETERRQLFAAVTRMIARLARERPQLLVLDDLHWADRSSLLLTRHVAGDPTLGRVLLVGTYRDNELDRGHPLPALIVDLERHRDIDRVALAGMDEDEVSELVDALHETGVRQEAARAIHGETDGNPFFVKQLVRHLEEVGGDRWAQAFTGLVVPQGVRDVISRRVSRLAPEAGPALRLAALIGRDFDFELLLAVADLDGDLLLDVLDEAVTGGLLIETAPARYSFAHALLRATLASDLSHTRRARLHRRIAEAIEARHGAAPDAWLGELARHFGAAGPGEASRAVSYAVRAAEQATQRLAHDEAVRLLLQALAQVSEPAQLAPLELALASAQAGAGDARTARESFARSARAAREAGDGHGFARAALGHSGGTWEQYGREDAASAALLEEALSILPDADAALRVSVLSRLAGILYYSDVADERIIGVAQDALAMARRLDDPEALAAALTAGLYARWGPGRPQDRLELADELVALADARGNPVAAAEAHVWRALALLELCRLDQAQAHLAKHAEIADRTGRHDLLGHSEGLRATLAVLAGDYEGGVAAAEAVRARTERDVVHGEPPSPHLLGMHGSTMITVLAERGELGTLLPMLETMSTAMGRLPAWRAVIAWAFAQAGDHDAARTEIARLSAESFRVVPRDANFISTLTPLAEAVAELGDGELAALIEPQLAPYRPFWVVVGIGAATQGPVAYHLGTLQLLQGRAPEALASFEVALDRAQAMRARPYVARSLAGLARGLRLRQGPGDAERGAAFVAEAAALARELGMSRLGRELAA